MHHNGSFRHNYGFYFTFWDRLMGTEHPHYAQTFREVTAVPARGDAPPVPGPLVMGGFVGLLTVSGLALLLG